MSLLSDGRFAFIDKRKNLYIESKVDANQFSLLYASTTLAFAFNEDMNTLALVCPDNAVAVEGTSARDHASRFVLKVYKFDDDELTELIDEVEVPSTTSILWLKTTYLVVSNPDHLTTILKLAKGKLKVIVRDKGVYPFASLNLLGLVSLETPSVDLWDVDRDKKLSSLSLQSRGAKKNKRKAVCGSCGTRSFAILLNENSSADLLHIAGKSMTLLSPPASLSFPLKDCPDGQGSQAKTRVRSHPLCTEISSSIVLVGVSPGSEVLRIVCKNGKFRVETKMKTATDEELVAIARNRCLLRKIDSTTEEEVIFTKPLSSLRWSSSIKAQDDRTDSAPGGQLTQDGLSISAKPKRKNRNKKPKFAQDDPSASEHLVKRITAHTRWSSISAIVVGTLAVGLFVAYYIRRR